MTVSLVVQLQVSDDTTGFLVPLQWSGELDQAAVGGGNPGTLEVNPGGEVVDLSELTSPGIAWVQNIDESSKVKFGPESGGSLVSAIELAPGDPPSIMKLDPAQTYRVKSSEASGVARVYVAVFEA